MFFQLLYIHLFRPFLKYTKETSPLPDTVSPRKLCTAAASMISKLMRLYKRSHGLRQICNVCVYIVHSACTIHLLNLPEKGAKRDVVHGVKHLEEISEGWLCARRSLGLITVLARKWKVELPEDATAVLERTTRKFGSYANDIRSPSPQDRREELTDDVKRPGSTQQQWPAFNVNPTGHPTYNPASLSNTSAGVPQQQPAPAVRTNSDGFRLPPFDANGLQAQNYPSATTTPQNPQRQSLESRGPVASPSDMFGGIEQLLRDSNEWTYRDQASLATGFENWTPMDVDPSVWDNSVMGGDAMSMSMNGAMPQQMSVHPVQGNGYASNMNLGMNGYSMDPLAGIGDENTMGYNEYEWYQ